ncbi:MAG: hypothetical protein PUB39_05635 [Eubacteriales bacterium]|nr:hypothetical protein [Eubacteriales bacterium]
MNLEDKIKKLKEIYKDDEDALALIEMLETDYSQKRWDETIAGLSLYFGLSQTDIDSLEA